MSDARYCVGVHVAPSWADSSWLPPPSRVGRLCRGHAAKLERTLAELPAVYEWLRQNLEPGSTGEQDKISGTKTPPVPIRLEVLDQADLIAWRLASWAQMVAEARGLAGPSIPTPAAHAAFLGAHVDWIVEQVWVDDLLAELGESLGWAHVLAPWRPGVHRLPAPCPESTCGQVTLTRWDGDGLVTCEIGRGGCGASWSEFEYERLCRVLAEEMG